MSRLHALLIATTSVLLCLGSFAHAHFEVPVPETPVAAIDLRQADLVSFVTALSQYTGVPIGMEVVGESSERQNYTVTQSTLGRELDNFVRTDRRYKWKQSGKAVNVFPASGLESVFDVKIHSFHIKNALPTQTLTELLKIQAISSYLSKKQIRPVIWLTGSASPARFSINVEQVSFREAVDQIVVSANGNGWTAFHQFRDGTDYLYFQLR